MNDRFTIMQMILITIFFVSMIAVIDSAVRENKISSETQRNSEIEQKITDCVERGNEVSWCLEVI